MHDNTQLQVKTMREFKIEPKKKLKQELRLREHIRNSRNNLIKNWTNNLNKYFWKDVQVTKMHKKKNPVSLIIKKVQIKLTLRYHLTY